MLVASVIEIQLAELAKLQESLSESKSGLDQNGRILLRRRCSYRSANAAILFSFFSDSRLLSERSTLPKQAFGPVPFVVALRPRHTQELSCCLWAFSRSIRHPLLPLHWGASDDWT